MIQPQAFECRILRQYRSPPIDSSSTTRDSDSILEWAIRSGL